MALKDIMFIYHLIMKFSTAKGTVYVKGCQYESRECYKKALKIAEKKRRLPRTIAVETSPSIGLMKTNSYP